MTAPASSFGHDLLLAVEPENVTAGGVGFLVIAGMAVGTVFLLRSLNKQLKKVDFEEVDDDVEDAEDRSTSDVAADAASADADDDSASGPSPADESEGGRRSPDG